MTPRRFSAALLQMTRKAGLYTLTNRRCDLLQNDMANSYNAVIPRQPAPP